MPVRLIKHLGDLLDAPAPIPGKILGWDGSGKLANRGYEQIISVSASGADYAYPQDAIAAAVAAGASSSTRYVIRIGPGHYDGPFTMFTGVDVESIGGPYGTIFHSTNDDTPLVTGAKDSSLEGVALEGPANVAAADYTGTGGNPFFLENIFIRSGYRGVYCHPASYGTVHCIKVVNQYLSRIEQFMRVDRGNLTAMSSSFMNGPPNSVGRVFDIEGANSTATLDLCQASNSNSSDHVYVDNGAKVRLSGFTGHKGTNGLHFGPTGSGSSIAASATVLENDLTQHVVNEGTASVFSFMGSANKLKVAPVSSFASLAMAFSDPTNKTFVVYGAFEAVQPWHMMLFFPGKPEAGQLMAALAFERQVTFDVDFLGSGYRDKTHAASQAQLTAKFYDGMGTLQQTGTVTVNTDGSAAFYLPGGYTTSIGDVLELTNQAPADATLADITLTLVGTRT